MSLRLVTIQSSKNSWLDEASAELSTKIGYFHKFELLQIKSSKKERKDFEVKKKEESLLILKNFKEEDYVVLFDENGTALNSKQFAEMIQRLQLLGTKRINFVIGGAFGVSEVLRKRSQKILKMSDFVLNHHVAQLVALEQIYRAFCILNNKPYHNE